MATVNIYPPDRAFCQDPIWIQLETDKIEPVYAYFQFEIPDEDSMGTTVRITWPGGSILFTVSDPNEISTDWPHIGGGTLLQYADSIEQFFRENEIITDNFNIVRTADQVIRLYSKLAVPETLTISENTIDNTTVTAVSTTTQSAPDNLRALVQVYEDTGDVTVDPLLIKLHAPYDFNTFLADIDISAAFNLKPHLPDATQINPDPELSALIVTECDQVLKKYYFRKADKHGTPAVAERLRKTESSYYAIWGSIAGDSLRTGPEFLCHNYRRADGANFVKPVTDEQPDWLYFYNFDTPIVSVFVNVLIYWSDMTTQSYAPFGSTPVVIETEKIYNIPVGFNQLKLNTKTPGAGTASNATIVAYDVRLGPLDDALQYRTIIKYQVYPANYYGHYLLFSNGLGGCETVALRGKGFQGIEPAAELYQRPRTASEGRVVNLEQGDFSAYNQKARRTWEFSTGLYGDPFYIQHLQQLPMADAWLVDIQNRRFLKVIVDAKAFQVSEDDQTLYSATFTLRAGWQDQSFNV